MTDPTPNAPAVVPEAVKMAVATFTFARDEFITAREHDDGSRQRDAAVSKKMTAADAAKATLEVAIATVLREATETLDQESAAIKSLYFAMCDRLHAATVRHDIGLGGEHVDTIVIRALDEQAVKIARLTAEMSAMRAALNIWAEREAECCPEGSGFVEYVSRLERRNDRLNALLEAALQTMLQTAQAETARGITVRRTELPARNDAFDDDARKSTPVMETDHDHDC